MVTAKYYAWIIKGTPEIYTTQIDWSYPLLIEEKTWCLYDLDEKKIYKSKKRVLRHFLREHKIFDSTRKKNLIIASPKNISFLPDIESLNFDSDTIIDGLDFSNLKLKYIASVALKKDYVQEKLTQRTKLDISYTEIFETEEEASEVCRDKFYELTTYQFPDFEFEEVVIPYYTYDLKPACLRNIDELIHDYKFELRLIEKEKEDQLLRMADDILLSDSPNQNVQDDKDFIDFLPDKDDIGEPE